MKRFVISAKDWTGSWRGSQVRSALVRCPKCRQECSLPHKVESNGDVNPSVVCPYKECDFHEFVTLEGWPNGGRLREEEFEDGEEEAQPGMGLG